MIDEIKKPNKDILKWIIVIVAGLVLVSVVFVAGIWVGENKAEFSYRWAENYHRNFAGPQGGFLGNFPQDGYTKGHGIFGSIIKIDANNLIIKDQDDTEQTIILSAKTTILNNKGNIKPSGLKLDDVVVVIGSPNNQGQIDAKLIRVLPPAPVSSNK